ncbi:MULTISPECIES: type IV secretory system conjugative DNA transfer family protein [Streptomyces]|uniref:Type IV secretory system conjugative DNA transfer family protein n=1 Tax=Streptomyces lonegramiae TaxID=3075524 RepID=A0ABU2XDH8_9ACTN|nr:type IV secretory system conjugative DNA transfer family protein [Streptomyces sp. DSM 41529]MDT0543964.1 type IV secretory system conjugative DNA transfer family protein [Streptomyces sp. DSM 41529]
MSKSAKSKSVTDMPGHVWSTDELIAAGVALLLAIIWVLGVLAWAAGGLVALVTNGGWPAQPFSTTFPMVIDLVVHWDDRALAWSVVDRPLLGPDWLFWSVYVILVILVGAIVKMVLSWIFRVLAQQRRSRHIKVRKAQRDNSVIWAKPSEVESLLVPDRNNLSGRVYLGEVVGTPEARLATSRYTSVAVIAPTGSSKTVKYVVPTILTWPDAIFVTSTKNDIADLTLNYRAETLGRPVYIFDPAGEWPEDQRKYLCAWSPLMAIRDFSDADKIALWLSEAAMENASQDGEARYWINLTQICMGPMLWIARKTNKTMQDIANWIGYQDFEAIERHFDEYERELDDQASKEDLAIARRGLSATQKRHVKDRSVIFANADVILKPFMSAQMAATTDIRFDEEGKPYSPFGLRILDIEHVLDTGGTVYAISDEEEQEMLRPVFQSVAMSYLRACRKRQRRQGAGPLVNPPLLLLEEAANVAPLPTLDKMAATYRGFGIVIMSIWQDESQVATLYATRAPTVLGNHTTRVYLPGSSDDTTLDRLSRLIGDQSVSQHRFGYTHQEGHQRITANEGVEDIRLAPIDYLRTLPKDVAVILSGNLPPLKVSATPWFKDPEMRARIGTEMCEKYDRAFGESKPAAATPVEASRMPARASLRIRKRSRS